MASPSLQLSEADIRLFLREAPRTSAALRRSVLVAAALLVTLPALFLLVNLPAFTRLGEAPSAPAQAAPPPRQLASVASPTPTPAATPPPAPSIPEDTLSLADLGISAPIHWDTPLDDAVVQKQLLTGVIHIQGTAKPGQRGYVVISGHSSNYIWLKGAYNNVFAPLLKAKPGQEIHLNYQNVEYVYRISGSHEVQPTDLSVLEDSSGTGLRLITCTPIGTSLRRLVVQAEQVSPDPSANTPFTPATFGGEVPNAR